MFKPTVSHSLILSGLLVGGLISVLLLGTQLPLWLVVLVALLALAIACWQVPQIGTRLLGGGDLPRVKQARSSWRYWCKRLAAFLTVALVLVAGEALWWAQRNTLPFDYAWKKISWELGFSPLPSLITIPAGKFKMGGEATDEQPLHLVKIFNPFQLTQHEITFEQYDYFAWSMRTAGIGLKHKADLQTQDNPYPEDEGWGRADRPVINVSWNEAQDYTNWLSQQTQQQCRLPSEAEWEYAARAGSTTDYPWGNKASHEQANYGKDACCDGLASGKDQWVYTAPVGQFPANALGLYDLHGNVDEWVQDCWHDDYSGAPIDGSAWESQCSNTGRRVLRGGSWNDTPNFVRSAHRFNYSASNRFNDIGFRVLCSSPFVH